MSAAGGTASKLRRRLAAVLCAAAILGALIAGCGNSPEHSTTGAGVGTTNGGVERTESDSGKTGGTPNTHIDKDGDAGKESGG